jgi:hypothetical protein
MVPVYAISHICDSRLDLTRQKTKGAEALELIIKESLSQSKDGVVTDTAIAAAENKFGKFAVDGSHIIQA